MSQNFRFDIAQKELEIIQTQIDKHDDISSKIKTWSVTLWAALLGWSFQTKRKELLFVGVFVLFLFWCLDAVNKNFRMDYRNRREGLAHGLQLFGETGNWPDNFKTPFFPEHYPIGMIRNFFRPHIFLTYLSLIVISLIIFYLV